MSARLGTLVLLLAAAACGTAHDGSERESAPLSPAVTTEFIGRCSADSPSPETANDAVDPVPVIVGYPAASALEYGVFRPVRAWVRFKVSNLRPVEPSDPISHEGWMTIDGRDATVWHASKSSESALRSQFWVDADTGSWIRETAEDADWLIGTLFDAGSGRLGVLFAFLVHTNGVVTAQCTEDQASIDAIVAQYTADHATEDATAGQVLEMAASQEDAEFETWRTSIIDAAHAGPDPEVVWQNTPVQLRVLEAAPPSVKANYTGVGAVLVKLPEAWAEKGVTLCTRTSDGWGFCSASTAVLPGGYLHVLAPLSPDVLVELVVVESEFPYSDTAVLGVFDSQKIPLNDPDQVLVVGIPEDLSPVAADIRAENSIELKLMIVSIRSLQDSNSPTDSSSST